MKIEEVTGKLMEEVLVIKSNRLGLILDMYENKTMEDKKAFVFLIEKAGVKEVVLSFKLHIGLEDKTTKKKVKKI